MTGLSQRCVSGSGWRCNATGNASASTKPWEQRLKWRAVMTMTSQIEHLILASVLTDLDFGQKYLPHLRPVYFSSVAGRNIFLCMVSRRVSNYDCAPSLEQVHVELKD